MNTQQAIQSIEGIAIALRNSEQSSVLLEQENKQLVLERERLIGQQDMCIASRDSAEERVKELQEITMQQAEQIGRLTGELKNLLQDAMHFGSRAAEALKSLEEKPEPMLPLTTEEEFKREPKVSPIPAPSWRKDVLKLIEEERKEVLSLIGDGEKITIDPQTNLGEKRTKYWYRCYSSGVTPSNWQSFPGIEVKVKGDKLIFVRFVPPNLPKAMLDEQEVESQRPFRKDIEPHIVGKDEPAFNGEPIPNFLKQGPKEDEDQRRKSSDF